MTNVIWTLSWLLQVLTAMSVLPKPNNLTLTSKKFIHLVTWKPGPDTPPDTYYNVSVHSGRGSWVSVCERVRRPLLCNLTEHFPDPNKVYYTRIQAVLGSNVSEPLLHDGFVPLKETEMEQPLLTVAPCGPGSLCVDLQPPEERLRNIYQTLHYRLKVQKSSPQPATFFQTREGLKSLILKDLVPGRQYCVFVSFYENFLPRRESNYSQPVCAFTTDLPAGRAIKIVAPLCVLVVCITVVLVLQWWTGFICLETVLPSILLDITIHPKEEQLVFEPCDGLISLVFVESASPSTGGEGNSNNRQSEKGYDDEGETEQESRSGSGGDGYTLRPVALSPSPSSSSSSSSSSPTAGSTSFEPVGSDQHAVLLLEWSNGVRDHTHSSPLRPTSPLQSAVGTDRHAPAAECTVLSTVPLPESNELGSSEACEMMLQPHVQGLGALTVGVVKTKVEGVWVKGSGQGVDLWSLSFGAHEPEEVNHDTAAPPSDGAEKALDDASAPLLLSSQEEVTDAMEEVAVETTSASEEEEEEEEEEECCGYMKR